MSTDKPFFEQFSRSAALYGEAAIELLLRSEVIVFGLGGVGGQCAVSLCRAGVGRLVLIDADCFSESNINRQAGAFRSTIGLSKAETMRKMLLDINPLAEIKAQELFYSAETQGEVDFSGASCIVDAIDTVSSKLLIIENAKKLGVPVVSCMGAGNKLDPSQFRAADIYESSGCPLARVMRSELRKRSISDVRVIYSPEPPAKPAAELDEKRHSGRPVPASSPFCPPAAGLIAACEAVNLILNNNREGDSL